MNLLCISKPYDRVVLRVFFEDGNVELIEEHNSVLLNVDIDTFFTRHAKFPSFEENVSKFTIVVDDQDLKFSLKNLNY